MPKRRRPSAEGFVLCSTEQRPLKLHIPTTSHVTAYDESCRYSYAGSSTMTDRSPDRGTHDRSMPSSPASPVPQEYPFGKSLRAPSSVASATSDQVSHYSSNVVDKFAVLRDAVYFSRKTPGFVLSADEKLVYPAGATWNRVAEPIEVDDAESYFESGWSLWTPDFSRRLKFLEYPIIQLARERPTTIQTERIGWLQPDGRKIICESHGQCLHDPVTNEYLGCVAWIEDLGDPEELRLKEQEAALSSFESICDGLPHQIFVTDANVQGQWFSRSFYEFTGLTEAEALGHGWEHAVHPDDVKVMSSRIEHMKRTGDDTEVFFRYQRASDGMWRWFSGRTHAIKDKNGKVLRWYGTNTDIHDTFVAKDEALKLERENARLLHEEHAARESNRMKSQFLANMSHELRTPIAGITGMVQLLSDTRLNAEQRDFLECVRTSAGNLLTIVNDILDVSKIESGRLQVEEIPFKPWSVIDEVAKMWKTIAIEKGLQFSVDCPEYLRDMRLIGDPTRVGQICQNLASNAIKFTSKGSIHIEASMTEVNSIATLAISVKDTGIGIDKSTLDTLFSPFRQGDSSTARVYGGSGLGLSISRNLAQLMGGTLDLESVPDEGTTATLQIKFRHAPAEPATPIPRKRSDRKACAPAQGSAYLPYTVESSPSAPDSGASASSDDEESGPPLPPRDQITVLIVEDNPINKKIAEKSVQKMGFSTATTSNGQEALDYLSDINHKADVILLDVMMPVVDGYEAARRLRTSEPFVSRRSNSVLHNPHLDHSNHVSNSKTGRPHEKKISDLPIIGLTASAVPGERETCLEAGFDDYMTKPLDALELEKKLIKWCFSGRAGKQRPMARRSITEP